MTAPKTGTPGNQTAAWENPLIPNKKLRALYTAMVELRMLEEFAASRAPRSRGKALHRIARGEEGCRVSTALDLKPGDLTSDSTDRLATAFLRGTKLSALLQSNQAKEGSAAPANPNRLPSLPDAPARLHVAMGASLALKRQKQHLLTIAYVYSDELTLTQWKPVLRFAGAQVLPIIFVVQAGVARSKGTMKPGQLSLASSVCGVPGIPVDAADPVALYRVAQESTLRARAGGGPVLIECVSFELPGRKAAPDDPILTMRQSLLHRGLVDETWLTSVESRFQRQLRAAAG